MYKTEKELKDDCESQINHYIVSDMLAPIKPVTIACCQGFYAGYCTSQGWSIDNKWLEKITITCSRLMVDNDLENLKKVIQKN